MYESYYFIIFYMVLYTNKHIFSPNIIIMLCAIQVMCFLIIIFIMRCTNQVIILLCAVQINCIIIMQYTNEVHYYHVYYDDCLAVLKNSEVIKKRREPSSHIMLDRRPTYLTPSNLHPNNLDGWQRRKEEPRGFLNSGCKVPLGTR